MGDEGRLRISTKKPPRLILGPCVPLVAHDADTIKVQVPMDAMIPGAVPGGWVEDVRLAHVNAPELATPEGVEALRRVDDWLAQTATVRLHVWGREKYGRLLGDLEDELGAMLSTFVLGISGSKPMVRFVVGPVEP
jgi:hypothetical protein